MIGLGMRAPTLSDPYKTNRGDCVSSGFVTRTATFCALPSGYRLDQGYEPVSKRQPRARELNVGRARSRGDRNERAGGTAQFTALMYQLGLPPIRWVCL